jgi:hypothetical protein
MIELWLKSNNTGVWESLDVGADMTISINKSFEQIEDFQTRTSTFSKTFTIPQTAKNNKFFSSSYNVNSSNFSNDIVVPAVVKYGGADVFNGSCRLNKIINSVRGGSYEIFLTQTLPDFANTLQEIKLINLDFTGLTHNLDYNTITSTWSYSGGSYENYTGITGTIVYPLGFYGYDDAQYFGQFEDSNSGFTSINSPIATTQFAPWISTKYLVDNMFNRVQFTYTSNFFNSDYFNGIFCLAKTNDTQGAQVASGSSDNSNVFLAESRIPFTDIGYANGDEVRYNFNTDYFDGFILRDELNDPLKIFSPSLNNTPSGRGHFFTTAVSGKYGFKVSFTASLRNAFLALYLNIAIKDVDNGTIYTQVQGLTIFNSSNPTTFTDIYMNATIPAGRRVALYYAVQNTGGDPYADIVFSYQKWELWTSPIISTSNRVLMQDNLPSEITCLDFFKGLVDTFNLVVIPTSENNILVERWDDYFNSGNSYDWSNKLDISTDYTIEPTNQLSKEYIIKYADSTDRLSLVNQQNRDQQFGTFRFVSNQAFHSGIKTISNIFEPLPITTFDANTESNILIPHIYTWNIGAETLSNQFEPYGSKLRLGFYQGLLDSTITGATKTWYMLSGATSVGQTTYPAISHLSSYEYSSSTFSDLNIGNQYDFWQQINDTYVGYTANDVYNNFWFSRISQLYTDDVKIFEGTFKLTPTEINTLNYNDRVYFLNAWWRLLQMEDADITNISLVKCKFIKLPFENYAPEPLIPPTYQQANTPTPEPTPSASTFQHIVYSSVNVLDMCNETAGQIVVNSNCSTLSPGCSVFSDTTATTPIDEATLIKASGGNTIYQVIEYGILTNFQSC